MSLSPDLKQLRDAGYDISVVGGYLFMRDVPHVNSKKEVRRGILAAPLTLLADVAQPPGDHQAYFSGDKPCDVHGQPLKHIGCGQGSHSLGNDVIAQFHFSNKARNDDGSHRPDKDYFEKMTRYADIICGPAAVLEPGATAKTFRVITEPEEDSVFKYIDTASSRAGIVAVSEKLKLGKIAIIGLGGTGSYVCDLVAKTPVGEIHLFDGDAFLQHNAFRSPGAPSIEELGKHYSKATYFAEIYSKMRRGIHAHEEYVTSENVDALSEMDFVFLCIDRCEPKKVIVDRLAELGKPFVDVGMGVQLVDDRLMGQLRVTASTPERRDHISRQICFVDANLDPDYDMNIQIADLNSLNAALAVIKWKKLFGFYLDLDREFTSTYVIDGNVLNNEECDAT